MLALPLGDTAFPAGIRERGKGRSRGRHLEAGEEAVDGPALSIPSVKKRKKSVCVFETSFVKMEKKRERDTNNKENS